MGTEDTDALEASRARVLAELSEHWRAGRIEAGDHERRTVAARNATTEADLEQALAGLPGEGSSTGGGMLVLGDATVTPGQASPSATTPPAATAPSGAVAAQSPGGQVEQSGRTEGLIRLERRVANGIMALVPFLALALFISTGSWLAFLLIPVAGIVLFGAGEGRS